MLKYFFKIRLEVYFITSIGLARGGVKQQVLQGTSACKQCLPIGQFQAGEQIESFTFILLQLPRIGPITTSKKQKRFYIQSKHCIFFWSIKNSLSLQIVLFLSVSSFALFKCTMHLVYACKWNVSWWSNNWTGPKLYTNTMYFIQHIYFSIVLFLSTSLGNRSQPSILFMTCISTLPCTIQNQQKVWDLC